MNNLIDDDFVAHYEGGIDGGNDPPAPKKGCFYATTDRDWMNINKGDLKVIDDLVILEHPLKKVPLKLIFSDIVYAITCQQRKGKSVLAYRREIEQELYAQSRIDEKRSHVLCRTEQEIDEDRDSIHDPFYRFGLGIYTYIKLQRSLATFLLFLSIISFIQMIIFYGDLSNINEKDMGEEADKLTPIEKFTSYYSLGSYYQAYPLCHDVPIEMNNIEIQCRGDMQIQEIQDVNIFKHGPRLCSSNKDEFKNRMPKKDFDDFSASIDKHSECNKVEFFKKKDEFLKSLEKDCVGKNHCNFNDKIHPLFDQTHKCWTDQMKQLDLVVQVKCGNLASTIASRNKTGIICATLGVLGNILFIIGITYQLSRRNKIRALKYAEYTVSSKNFSCELVFDDDHFDYLCYDKDASIDSQWYQDIDGETFKDENDDYVVSENHWTYQHRKPGHALQDEVARVILNELTQFYGLDKPTPEEWRKSEGYQYFQQGIKKFPDAEQEDIEQKIIEIQYGEERTPFFQVVFCTFAFKNKDVLVSLATRAGKLTELKTCKEEKKKANIQAVLDYNFKMVSDLLGGATKIEENQEDDANNSADDNEGGDENENSPNPHGLDCDEDQIKALLNEKRVNLMTPQSAFITFRNPFAAFLSKKMVKTIKNKKFNISKEERPKIFEKDLVFDKVGYPTDTLYTNFGVSKIEKMVNFVFVAIIVYFWAYAFFYSMWTLYQMMQNRNLLFLPKDQCQTIWDEYNGRKIQFADNAIEEYYLIKNGQYGFSPMLIANDVPLMQKLRGEFTCFCDWREKNQKLEFDDVERMFDPSREIENKCGEYYDLKFKIKYIKLIVTIFMAGCNAISKKIIMWIITMLNFKKKSHEAIYNFYYLLSTTAFTSIIVILLLGAKLDFIPFFGKFLKDGKNRDFTWEWYMEIGSFFIYRMMLLTIGPIIEVCAATPTKIGLQHYFRRTIGQKPAVTMWQYYKSELGNPWFFETNLFKLGNVLFMAFMFGAGIPIMFPLALVFVLINEMALRFQLAYQCKSPINYSMEMNRSFINFCSLLPIFYGGFGLWMYSNRQVYDNAVLPKAFGNGLQDHSHTVVYTLTTFTPGTPYLLLLAIAIPNAIIMFCNLKYHKIASNQLADKIRAMRHADLDHFYQYIRFDPQYKLFMNLNIYLETVLGTIGVSKSMWDQFNEEVKNEKEKKKEETEGGEQLFASRLLYEMIIDHNYASYFDFRYSLIQNELTNTQLLEKLNLQNLQKTAVKKEEGLEEFNMDKFVCAEDTKTLFMIHYAFIDQKLRLDTQWLTEETFLEYGKLVGKKPVDGASGGGALGDQRRPIFDIQDLAIL